MHAWMADVIDPQLARRLVASQFPRWASLPLRPVTRQGVDNRTFRLGTDLSVRFPAGNWYVLQVEKNSAGSLGRRHSSHCRPGYCAGFGLTRGWVLHGVGSYTGLGLTYGVRMRKQMPANSAARGCVPAQVGAAKMACPQCSSAADGSC
jgi:hypothetical protein